MAQIITIHSYRGGTGKSNITANLAYLAARRGLRVAVLDTDLQSPGVHVVLGLDKDRLVYTLTDYLFGKCDLEEAAYDLTGDLDLGVGSGGEKGGALFLLPSSMKVEAIVRIVSEGYDVSKLNQHFGQLTRDLELDLMIVDSHPGLNRETMLTTAVSDILLLVIRPDSQDFHGTAVLMEVAGSLGVPRMCMMANKVSARLDADDVVKKIESAFGQRVIGLLPLSDDMAVLGSRGVFAAERPDHPISKELGNALNQLLSGNDSGASS